MNVGKIQQKTNNFAHNYFDMHDNHYNGLREGYKIGYETGAMDFAIWLRKNAQPRFPNINEWYLLKNPNKDINAILTLKELYKIFENED